ncbi:restriction endonuclease subunit S [Muribaculaceae bacterium Isolate-036 (Harlan)]|nr:restriction endonuclease subunit S [Muribaculaceae bacterium Isolate-036 (Harlan)]
MAQDKDQKTLNVPPLRFTGFTGDWKKTTLGEIGKTFNGLTGKNSNDFGQGSPYITYKSIFDNSKVDISRVEYVTITDNERIKSAQNVVRLGDIFFTTSSETPTEVGMTSVLLDGIEDCYLNSFCFGYRLSNKEETLPEYFRFYLRASVIRNKLSILAQGSTRFNISKNEVMRMGINLPNSSEQEKIAALLSCIDERITTQNKIIEKYESLIKGIAQHCIKESTSGNTYVKLGDICQITTGKLDANAQVDNGIYPFFTCAEQPFKIDSFAFDTEALLISGNGANLGYINYYNGKFNAYQRTYVLDIFSENIQYIKWALKVLLPQRIAIEKSSSNTPYIVLSTLSDLRLPIPNKSNQCHIAKLMQSLERKLSSQITLNDSYNKLKQYLLRQMFI